MTFTEQLKLRDIKKIAKYQEKIQEIKESNEPFMVECVDDEDYYHEWMGNGRIKRSNLSCIMSWEQYTIDDIITTREWKQMRRIGKGYYHPSRFIIIE